MRSFKNTSLSKTPKARRPAPLPWQEIVARLDQAVAEELANDCTLNDGRADDDRKSHE